ncbi:serine/threonine protein kinase, negative regulator of sexual conjugation and meiosis [Roridomyces roridus]|uniref:non-specific serine/threonine protein kinase n=1 Tax=Roridomyces roridus TaxID=1738132 RepID=A0AAD7C4M3_9AGAR|nr:serine/threonine protein kinase, negative regulator of sexual conjugation and meiosis [Roridomyces roridus]
MSHTPEAQQLPNFLGQVLQGRYKVVERLGSGAYGVVYKALDLSSPHPVHYAIKCVKRQRVGTREGIFQARELKLHKLVCAHPNILTMHRFFSDGRHIFVVLDFCHSDLFRAITEQHLFHRDTALTKRIFVQILDAVEHCARNSVYHRDLKPENILCDSTGDNIRLADFGLATQACLNTDFGLGSPYYMSPEGVNTEYSRGTYAASHADIWSLGVILTNMICGRNPWKLADPSDDCFRSFLENADFLLYALPISPGANEILKWCFRLHAGSRPSISQLRTAILELDTFFLSDEELAESPSHLRAVAQHYAEPTPAEELSPEPERPATPCEEPKRSSSSFCSTDSEEGYLYSTPPFGSPGLEVPFSSGSSSVSASDGSSFNGPITPVVHAIDPIEEVPDMEEDENIDESAVFPLPMVDVPLTDKPKPQSRSILRRAVRRIKAMAY